MMMLRLPLRHQSSVNKVWGSIIDGLSCRLWLGTSQLITKTSTAANSTFTRNVRADDHLVAEIGSVGNFT